MKTFPLIAGLVLAGAAAAAAPAIDQLRRNHRLLIVSAPAGDRALAAQRATLGAWRKEGVARDVLSVILDGSKVEGAGGTAAAIRTRYAVPAGAFSLALVGKDGHVAYRASKPVDGKQLEGVIDAMPMRRAGER